MKEFTECSTAWRKKAGSILSPCLTEWEKRKLKGRKREKNISHAVWNQAGELIANMPGFRQDSEGETIHNKNIQNYSSYILKDACRRKNGKATADEKILLRSGLSWFLKVQETIGCARTSHISMISGILPKFPVLPSVREETLEHLDSTLYLLKCCNWSERLRKTNIFQHEFRSVEV